MPKSKARSSHKKKVAQRNTELKNRKARSEKMQKEFIMNLIKQEQEKGMFNNVPSGDGPIIDGPMINGPSISFDGDLLTLNNNVVDIESEEVKKD